MLEVETERVTRRVRFAKHAGHIRSPHDREAMKGRFIVPLWTDIRASGRLRLLHEDWGLVGAGSPACRHGDVQHAQIDAKLAAVLIPVAEHDVAQELAARLS